MVAVNPILGTPLPPGLYAPGAVLGYAPSAWSPPSGTVPPNPILGRTTLYLSGCTPGATYSAVSSVSGDVVPPQAAGPTGIVLFRWYPSAAGTVTVAGPEGVAVVAYQYYVQSVFVRAM